MDNEKFQDLVLEHLARLTQDNTEIKMNIQKISQRLDQVEGAVIRIENDHGEKIKALFDAQEVMMEKMERFSESQTRMEDKLDRLSLKVSVHDTILKRVK